MHNIIRIWIKRFLVSFSAAIMAPSLFLNANYYGRKLQKMLYFAKLSENLTA